MTSGRKQRISEAFGAAAGRYDDHAGPQRFAAALVAELAYRQKPGGVMRILEVGCGTGLLTRDIQARWPAAELIVTDLSPAMVARAGQGAMVAGTFLPMDGESPPFEGPWFDLIVSSLAFQWFDDLAGACDRLVGLLRPGGSLIFSTMGAGSFARWRAAHARCELSTGIPAYPDLGAIRAMLAHHADAFAFDEEVPLLCGGARGLLAHLKGIGAIVADGARRPLSVARLRQVMAMFDAEGGEDFYQILFARITAAGA
ncbi:MAG: methyltransferase domain-containing protein [Sphingobium sp.]